MTETNLDELAEALAVALCAVSTKGRVRSV